MKSKFISKIEEKIKGFKRVMRFNSLKTIRKCCPNTLRNFDVKYPELGKFKNDVISIGKFLIVRSIFITVVIPVITIIVLTETVRVLVKSLFKGK